MGSVIAITIASLLQRKISLDKNHKPPPSGLSLFYKSLAPTLAVVFPAILGEKLVVDWIPAFISSLLWRLLFVSFLAYSLMWILIGRIDATKVASLFYLGPPVTMVMAWIVFGDKVQIVDLAGVVLVFLGGFMTYLKFSSSSKRVDN